MTAEDEASLDNGGDDDDDDGPETGDNKARKRKERLEQNRISARESRKRKKTMIEELQRTVITLSRENKELNERNEQLRRQLMEIGSKYPNVVPLQAIVGQATQASTAAAGSPNVTVSGGGDGSVASGGGAPSGNASTGGNSSTNGGQVSSVGEYGGAEDPVTAAAAAAMKSSNKNM